MTTIVDGGQWNWTLSVKDDGELVARKAIPYDGSKVVTTRTNTHPSRTARRHGSEFGLSAEDVLTKFTRYAETSKSADELAGDIIEVVR